MLTYLQAIIIGLFQGVTELFPVSSLGHSVLIPYIFGWHNIVHSQSQSESFFLAFLVALHVATALALLLYYRKVWAKLIVAFFTSIRHGKVTTSYERLIWLIIVATIPAGLAGLLFEHVLRTQFAKPLSAAVFLMVNGLILFAGDRVAKKQAETRKDFAMQTTAEHTAKAITTKRAGLIGFAQIFALFAGISRSGITMVSGLYSGLDYEDSARFSFLLATPIILAAGVYKIPDLLGVNGHAVRGQIFVGALCAGVSAYLAVRFLDKYFRNKRLRPFAIYSFSFGLIMVLVQVF